MARRARLTRRRGSRLCALLFALALVTTTQAAEWPTYQADYARSGVSPDRISTPLSEASVFRPTHPPQPAWSGEAKRDAYSKINDLRPRQISDKAFHVVIAGDAVFFGSSADDPLRSDLPERRGCGTMAASMNSFFYRNFFHGMWDLKTDQRAEFLGIRGGCWLGLIPSGGMVLAPETSSGCSCTHSIQTSLACIPKPRRASAAAK